MSPSILRIVMLSLALGTAQHAAAQNPQPAAAQNITGSWTLSAEGYVLSLTFQQVGTRLTGTMEITHGAFPIVGEIKKGRMHFAGTSDGGGIRHDENSNELDVFAIGELQPDGTLSGTMVSTVGNFTWRAVRKDPVQ